MFTSFRLLKRSSLALLHYYNYKWDASLLSVMSSFAPNGQLGVNSVSHPSKTRQSESLREDAEINNIC